MEEASKGELRKRLEALQQERERCEEKKVGLFRAVNRLKQGLQEGSIDEQRYNEELAKLGPSPQQIISGCNEEIKGIQDRIIDCEEQLRKLAEARNKDAITFVVVLAALMLFSVGTAFLTVQLTGFLIKEEVTAYSQEISVNFTQPQQYALNVSKLNISGELRSLSLSGKLIGEGQARVYLQKGEVKYLVFDTAALQEKGIKSLISVTGHAVEDMAADADKNADKNADKKVEKEGEKAAKDAEKEEKKAAEENITAAANESETNITPQLPTETNLTLNETPQPEQQELPEPEPVAPVEKAINISLAYNSGTVFDSNDDGIELDISAIDFTVEQTNFSWPADQSKLCTRWVTNSLDNGTSSTVCQGSSDCCALVELAPSEPNWNDAFYMFVGRNGATYNNTVSSQVIFANYSLEPGNVYSEIYYSQFATLPAVFVSAPKLENVTEEVPVTNVTVIEFSSICVETCSLAGIAGLNLSEYTLVVEVDNATLVLDNAAYTLAKAVEIDTEAPVVTILLPLNITYYETIAIAAAEVRNTTTLSLNFAVSEPASWVGYSLNGHDNITITTAATTTITAANGTNSLILYAMDEAGNVGYAVAQFFINFTTAAVIDVEPPLITISSPLSNATYNATAIPLNFTISEPAAVSYFLNIQPKADASENITLNSSEGRNRLLMLATDAAGNVGSATVIFFVNTSNITAANITVTNLTANITPLLKSKKPHFKLGEDAELEFEYVKKTELVKVGKWKDEYEGYEENYEDYIETVSAAKRATIEQAVEAEKAKAKRKQLKEWVTENETITAQLFDGEGRKASIGAEIEELREGRFSIKLPKQRQFRAGLYKVVVELERDGKLYTVEQDFTWGVLAINTNKSIFLPNEDALIAMAVLDDQGHMVCDADVTLTITEPSNAATTLTTANGKINVSPECHVYGVTNLPDYYTTYAVKGVGTYVMNLTAATANGVRTILDNFTVQSQVDFDVARTGPTRIYPVVPYTMNITIAANSNYNGPVIEYVPASFVITQQQGLTVTTVADTKILNWDVKLKKDDTINIYYTFDAPDISPEFYILGELGIGTWKEARQWQVASDAVSLTDDSFTIVPTMISIGELVNLSGKYSAGGGGGNCWINLTVTEGGTLITTSSSTAVKLVDIFFVAPCDRKTLATGRAECDNWAATDDAIPINFTVTGVTGGGAKTYTTAKQAGCGITIDASDTLTVNAPPNVTIIVPPRININNTNVSGLFVINASLNDSESNALNVNLTIFNNTGNATGLIPMNLSSGSLTSGYWNVTFDSTTLRDARYNLSINATDSAPKPNTTISANVSIIIDNTKPNATAISPSNGTVINTITINASVNDSLTKVLNATFRLTTSTGSTLTSWIYATIGTGTFDQGYWNTTFDTLTVPDNTYNITVNATDFAGNQQILNLSQITIENLPNVLKVDLGIPAEDSITEISQNATFNVTANVTCNDACGNVNATLRYNISGLEPNENISTQNGTTPFYITGAGGAAVVSYDFNATYWPSTLHNASYNQSYDRPPSDLFFKDTEFDGGTTATANNYSSIKVLSDVWYARFTVGATSTYATQKFTFRINESETSISKLNITINFTGGNWASGPDTYTTKVNVSVWNSSAWETFLNCAGLNTGGYFVWCLRNISITQNIANYINESDNNAVYILVQTHDPRGGIGTSEVATDYISLNVTTTGTGNPYSCGNMAAGESCNVTWTVNATLPLGSEWYIDVNFTSDDSLVQSNDTGNAQIKNVSLVAVPDTTAPNVTIIVPPRININNTNVSGSFLINASVNDSESNVLRVNLTVWNNTGNATGLIPMNLSSGGLQSGYWNVTFDSTTLPDGYYNLSVNATDSAATPNTAISANVSIIIDNTLPNATISSPANNTNLTSLATVTADVLVNDTLAGIFNVRVRMINSTNGATAYSEATLQSGGTIYQGTWRGSISTAGLAETVYNITASANDTAGNIFLLNVSEFYWGDATVPNATTLEPANQSNISGTITVRAGANDTVIGIGNVTFQFRNSTNQTTRELMSLNTGNIYAGEWTASYNTAQLADGKYNITFNATDFAGNNNMTDLHQNFTVTIDNTIPNGTILSPANATNIRGFFTINASVNDTLTKVQNVSFRVRKPGYEGALAFAALATGTTDQGVWNASLNSSTVANGVYNITLNATDFAGNQLLVNTSNVTVNNTGILNITFNGPKGGRNITQNSTFTVNATITCSNGYCQQVNGTVYYNLTSLSPATRINATALEVPFHNATTFVNQTCDYLDIDAVCSLNWTINATGAIGSMFYFSINFTSNNSEISQNGTSNFQINITEPVVTNTAPIAFNSSVALNSSVDLTEGGKKEVVIKFNVTDTDGTTDLVNAGAGVNITYNGIRRANNSGNCQNLGDSSSTTRLYSCIVVFNYFDNASSIWEINLSAADSTGAVGYNDSTPSRGGSAANNLTINSLSAFSLVADSLATTTNINTQNVELSFAINNTGNFDFTILNVTAFDLNASLTDFFKLGYNFSINATQSGSGFGTNLTNATPVNFTATGDGLGGEFSATLPHKITNGESDNLGNRTLYIYIDIPYGLSTGITYNSSTAWQLFAS